VGTRTISCQFQLPLPALAPPLPFGGHHSPSSGIIRKSRPAVFFAILMVKAVEKTALNCPLEQLAAGSPLPVIVR